MAGLSPTQRTLRALRDQGLVCAIVEKFNSHVGIRQDLFGILDIIALDPERGVVGIQSCGQGFAEHFTKLTVERAQQTSDWLSTPGTSLELWGWRRTKLFRGSKAIRWTARTRILTLNDLGSQDADADLWDQAAEDQSE